jgi:hypothetical protein
VLCSALQCSGVLPSFGDILETDPRRILLLESTGERKRHIARLAGRTWAYAESLVETIRTGGSVS